MTQEEVGTKVHQFIRKNFLFDEKTPLTNDQSLLGSGVVDSTGILELISFLEDTCRVKFEDSELVADNFDTIDKISGFIIAKLAREKA
jgi:acyl carrier protein